MHRRKLLRPAFEVCEARNLMAPIGFNPGQLRQDLASQGVCINTGLLLAFETTANPQLLTNFQNQAGVCHGSMS